MYRYILRLLPLVLLSTQIFYSAEKGTKGRKYDSSPVTIHIPPGYKLHTSMALKIKKSVPLPLPTTPPEETPLMWPINEKVSNITSRWYFSPELLRRLGLTTFSHLSVTNKGNCIIVDGKQNKLFMLNAHTQQIQSTPLPPGYTVHQLLGPFALLYDNTQTKIVNCETNQLVFGIKSTACPLNMSMPNLTEPCKSIILFKDNPRDPQSLLPGPSHSASASSQGSSSAGSSPASQIVSLAYTAFGDNSKRSQLPNQSPYTHLWSRASSSGICSFHYLKSPSDAEFRKKEQIDSDVVILEQNEISGTRTLHKNPSPEMFTYIQRGATDCWVHVNDNRLYKKYGVKDILLVRNSTATRTVIDQIPDGCIVAKTSRLSENNRFYACLQRCMKDHAKTALFLYIYELTHPGVTTEGKTKE